MLLNLSLFEFMDEKLPAIVYLYDHFGGSGSPESLFHLLEGN